MPTGQPGADSAAFVTNLIDGQSLISHAQEFFGGPPVYWGRYFSSPFEYRHVIENQALRAAGIPVLPIAGQTTRVGGTQADGQQDAIANVTDLIATFGAAYLNGLGRELYLFLDVEGSPTTGSPSLSESYYLGWAETLMAHSQAQLGGNISIQPCLYATRGDSTTWIAVNQAIQSGTVCRGAGVADWLAEWPTTPVAPPEWDHRYTQPSTQIPILLWQYYADYLGGGGLDLSVTNPSIDLEADLVRHLILPPAP